MSAEDLTSKTDQVDDTLVLTGGEPSLQSDYESIVGSLRFGINTLASKSYREPPRTFVTIYESHLSETHRDYKVTEVLFDQLRMAHQTCVWVKGQDSEGNEAVFAIPETATRTRPDEIRVRAELVTVSDIREIIQPRREDAKHFRKILLQSIYLNGPPLPPLLERILGSAIVDTRLECERVRVYKMYEGLSDDVVLRCFVPRSLPDEPEDMVRAVVEGFLRNVRDLAR